MRQWAAIAVAGSIQLAWSIQLYNYHGHGYTIMCIAIENQYNAVRAPWVVLRGSPRLYYLIVLAYLL